MSDLAEQSVLLKSGELPCQPVEVKGYDFEKGLDYAELLKSFKTCGFQATNFGLAVDEIKRMVYFNFLLISPLPRAYPTNYY